MHLLLALLACSPLATSGVVVDADSDTDTDTDADADTDADTDADSDADADTDSDADTDADTDTDSDADTDTDAGQPTNLPPGLTWVRSNRPFISGLTVRMGTPPADEVDRYFDDFGATAAHLWVDGLPGPVAGWSAAAHPDFRWFSWLNREGLNSVTGQPFGTYPVTPGRIGYQVGDEPRNIADVDEIQVGVDRVRAHDPDALVVLNFGGTDGSIDELDLADYAITTLQPDVVSYDTYSHGHLEYERAMGYRNLGLQHQVPYWRYIDSYGDYERDELPPDDLRWAAMLGLVYGFSGHSWFMYQINQASDNSIYATLFDEIGTWDHVPNAHFAAAAQVNRELEVYAETINQLTSTAVTYEPTSVLYMPDGHQPFSPGTGGDPYLQAVSTLNLGPFETQEWSLGLFIDDAGEHYVMVQNANRHETSFPLYRPQGRIRLTLDFDTAPSSVDTTVVERLDPLTGQVVDHALVPLPNGRMAFDITLDAGDVTLFKYATGASFATRP